MKYETMIIYIVCIWDLWNNKHHKHNRSNKLKRLLHNSYVFVILIVFNFKEEKIKNSNSSSNQLKVILLKNLIKWLKIQACKQFKYKMIHTTHRMKRKYFFSFHFFWFFNWGECCRQHLRVVPIQLRKYSFLNLNICKEFR